MIAHAPFRRLAIARIDAALAPADRDALDAHLAGCAACRSYASAVQRDAADLRAVAFAHAPARVRAAVLAEAARPARRSDSWRLLLVAAALLVALVGGSLAVGAVIDRLRSPRPVTWSAVATPALLTDPAGSVQVPHVATISGPQGDRLVSIAARGGGLDVLVASDAATWTVGAVRPFGEGRIAIAGLEVVAAPDGPLLVAHGSLGETPTIWTSVDGTSWAAETVGRGRGPARAVTVHAGRLVAAVSGESPGFWSRPIEGGAWAAGSVASGQEVVPEPAASFVLTERELVAIGRDTTYRSPDGVAWTALPNDLRFEPTGVIAHDGAFVAVGRRGRDAASARSTDGTRWHELPAEGSPTGDRSAVVSANGMLLAVGAGATGARAWLSVDGLRWNEVMDLPDGRGGFAQDATVASGRVVAVGSIGSDGAIWQSTEVGR